MKVNLANVGNVEDLDSLRRFASSNFSQISQALNGNITFTDNIVCRFIDVSFLSANVVTAIPHGLGRLPLIWICGNIDADAVVFQGQSSDNNNLYLEASATCNVRIMVI